MQLVKSGRQLWTQGFKTRHMRVYRPFPGSVLSYHLVQQGETWTTIAKRYGVSVDLLVGFNCPGAMLKGGGFRPALVNWFLFNNIYFRCPKAPDGVNAMFRGGEMLAIPKHAVALRQPEVKGLSDPPRPPPGGQGHGRGAAPGESMLCWAGMVICDGMMGVAADAPGGLRGSVATTPPQPLFSGTVRDALGQSFDYSVSGKVVSIRKGGQDVMSLRLDREARDSSPSSRALVERWVKEAVAENGMRISRPGNPVTRALGRGWAAVYEHFDKPRRAERDYWFWACERPAGQSIFDWYQGLDDQCREEIDGDRSLYEMINPPGSAVSVPPHRG